MRNTRIPVLVAALSLAVLLFAVQAMAQATGSVAGMVLSPQRQPLVGAIVELTLDGKVVDTDVTSFDGRFKFSSLKPTGPYEVVISMPESEPLRSGTFTLSPGQTMDATVTYE